MRCIICGEGIEKDRYQNFGWISDYGVICLACASERSQDLGVGIGRAFAEVLHARNGKLQYPPHDFLKDVEDSIKSLEIGIWKTIAIAGYVSNYRLSSETGEKVD
jgi:hypothetical protein